MHDMDDQLLIVGASGMIGRRLAYQLRSLGEKVICADKTSESGSNQFRIDFCEGNSVSLLAGVKQVIFCASPNYKQPADLLDQFFAGAAQFLSKCIEKEKPILFLSTNHVFDGSGLPRIGERTNPICLYGQHKAAFEELALRAPFNSVIRLTKVIGPHSPPFDEWIKQLRIGNRVEAFANVSIAPISLSFVVQTIAHLALERRAGLFHLSSLDQISFADALLSIARRLGLAAGLIKKVQADPKVFLRVDTEARLDCGDTELVLERQMPMSEEALAEFATANAEPSKIEVQHV